MLTADGFTVISALLTVMRVGMAVSVCAAEIVLGSYMQYPRLFVMRQLKHEVCMLAAQSGKLPVCLVMSVRKDRQVLHCRLSCSFMHAGNKL